MATELREDLVRPLLRRTNHTQHELAQRIREDNPPHVARVGDGEMACILGWTGNPNCDAHPYSERLADAIALAICRFVGTENLWLGNWFNWALGFWLHGFVDSVGGHADWTEHTALMHVSAFPLEPVRDIYLGVSSSARRKLLIGPKPLGRLKGFLRLNEHVVVPEVNGWSQFQPVSERCRAAVQPRDLVLIAFGLPAKPLMATLLDAEPTAAYLDVGSGLDPLIRGRRTRPTQPDWTVLRKLYGEALDDV